MIFHIKQAKTKSDFERYYQLRWQLLRAPWKQKKGSEIDDIEQQCFHLMAVDKKKEEVIGVARLQFNSANEAQVRYMAVFPAHENHGIGRALLNALEQHAKKSSHKIIMLDARENAVGFYQKLGYKIIKKSYLLFDEIQHFRMSKKL